MTADGAADAIEPHGRRPVPEPVAHRVRPPGGRVVDGVVGAQLLDDAALVRPSGQADRRGAAPAAHLQEQRSEATSGRRDERDVAGLDRGDVGDRHRRPARAHHRHGVDERHALGQRVERVDARHGHLGVAPTRRAEVGDHPPPEPRTVHPRTHRVDGPGHLPSGGHRELGKRERSAGATAPDRRVDQVDARRRHDDANLTRGRLRVGHLVVAQDLWRPELVLPDGVHVRRPRGRRRPR